MKFIILIVLLGRCLDCILCSAINEGLIDFLAVNGLSIFPNVKGKLGCDVVNIFSCLLFERSRLMVEKGEFLLEFEGSLLGRKFRVAFSGYDTFTLF